MDILGDVKMLVIYVCCCILEIVMCVCGIDVLNWIFMVGVLVLCDLWVKGFDVFYLFIFVCKVFMEFGFGFC